MQPEVKLLLDLFDQVDNDCKDALFAYWKESDKLKKQMLFSIYEEKDLEREKIAKEMNRLCQTQ